MTQLSSAHVLMVLHGLRTPRVRCLTGYENLFLQICACGLLVKKSVISSTDRAFLHLKRCPSKKKKKSLQFSWETEILCRRDVEHLSESA